MNCQFVFCVLLAVALGLPSGCDADGLQEQQADSAATEQQLVRMGTVSDPRISESSGLARCGAIEGAYWTHNDSAAAPELFLISSAGRTLAVCAIDNAANVDWEAMTSAVIEGRTYLIIGDVGDNLFRRESYQLYIVPEPALSDAITATAAADLADEAERVANQVEFEPESITARALRLEFAFDDGSHNFEAIAFDSTEQKIWMVEKVYLDDRRESQPGFYTLDVRNLPEMVRRSEAERAELDPAERIGDFPVRNVTGMDISPDGSRMLIRTYLTSFMYTRIPAGSDPEKENAAVENAADANAADENNADERRREVGREQSGEPPPEVKTWTSVVQTRRPVRINLPIQMQGEAVCFTADSRWVVVTSERPNRPLWKVSIDVQLEMQRARELKAAENNSTDDEKRGSSSPDRQSPDKGGDLAQSGTRDK